MQTKQMSTYYYVINNKQETRSEPIYLFEWTYNGGSALFGMYGTESEYNAKMVLKGNAARLVTQERLSESVDTGDGVITTLNIGGTCDTCSKPATRVMCKYTCKDCAEWFYGHYCDKCFDLVSEAMTLSFTSGIIDYPNFISPEKKSELDLVKGVMERFKARFKLHDTITGRLKSP